MFSYLLPHMYALFLTLFFCTLSYIGYRLSRLAFRRLFRGRLLATDMLTALEKPLLFFHLEIALFLSLEFFTFSALPFLQHFLVILFISTVGYFSFSMAKVFYRFGIAKYATQELGEISQRSTLTQIHFIYRLGIAIIFILTFSAIVMTFPKIKSLGIGLLGSAGIAGIALGVAAKPIILNIMAGIQIAFTKTLKIGDAIVVEGENAIVESLQLTYIVAKSWDFRRFILPTSYFIEHPFQNWSACSSELLGSVFLYCDYSVPVEALRKKFEELLKESPYFNGSQKGLYVTGCDEKAVELRLTMTAKDAPSAFQLRAFIREKMIDFIQKEYPGALPTQRLINK